MQAEIQRRRIPPHLYQNMLTLLQVILHASEDTHVLSTNLKKKFSNIYFREFDHMDHYFGFEKAYQVLRQHHETGLPIASLIKTTGLTSMQFSEEAANCIQNECDYADELEGQIYNRKLFRASAAELTGFIKQVKCEWRRRRTKVKPLGPFAPDAYKELSRKFGYVVLVAARHRVFQAHYSTNFIKHRPSP